LVGESAADNGLDIDIWIAYLGEIPIAFEFTLTTGAICYRLAGHYKQAYAKHGLGWVLSHHNLRHLIARGVRYVDHAPGDVEYKQVWGAKEEESSQRVDWFMLPNNLIGSLGKALTSIPVIRKRIESKMHGD
jgi:CelD/BcsL family acetyltransferase involved in cellulose biosynthesis